MAFISLPLLFQILDTRFFHSRKSNNDHDARHQRLQVLINAVKDYRSCYEGAEWLTFALRHAVSLVESAPPRKHVASWTDLLAETPSYCLTLTVTIEMSLNQVKIPKDGDYPTALRGVFKPKLCTVQEPRLAYSTGAIHINSVSSSPATKGMDSSSEPLDLDSYFVSPAVDIMAIQESLAVRRQSSENIQPASDKVNPNDAEYRILHGIQPDVLEMMEVNESAAALEAQDPLADAQHPEHPETPDDVSSDHCLDLDGMSFDIESGLTEGDILELLS